MQQKPASLENGTFPGRTRTSKVQNDGLTARPSSQAVHMYVSEQKGKEVHEGQLGQEYATTRVPMKIANKGKKKGQLGRVRI